MRPDRAANNLVGQVLRELRKDLGWTLGDVETRSGREFCASVIGAYERGERCVSVERLFRICALYSTDPRLVLDVIEQRRKAAA